VPLTRDAKESASRDTESECNDDNVFVFKIINKYIIHSNHVQLSFTKFIFDTLFCSVCGTVKNVLDLYFFYYFFQLNFLLIEHINTYVKKLIMFLRCILYGDGIFWFYDQSYLSTNIFLIKNISDKIHYPELNFFYLMPYFPALILIKC